ncbi:MAG: hypothetical protein VYA53_01930 [Acidobacteriota bacterium]|nr:hypothetical protein [Acidobacteriota bacterium]
MADCNRIIIFSYGSYYLHSLAHARLISNAWWVLELGKKSLIVLTAGFGNGAKVVDFVDHNGVHCRLTYR